MDGLHLVVKWTPHASPALVTTDRKQGLSQPSDPRPPGWLPYNVWAPFTPTRAPSDLWPSPKWGDGSVQLSLCLSEWVCAQNMRTDWGGDLRSHLIFTTHKHTHTHRDKARQCPPPWWFHFRGPLRSRNSVMEALSLIHLSIVSVINVALVSSKSLCSIKLIFKSTQFHKAATPFAEQQSLCLCLRGSCQLGLFNLDVPVSVQTKFPRSVSLVFSCPMLVM